MIFGVSRISIRGKLLPTAIALITAGFFFYTAHLSTAADMDSCSLPERAAAPFVTFPGSNLGAIPDGGTPCNPMPGAPRNVTFNVAGAPGPPTGLSVSMTFGSPNHTWMGDIVAELVAPNGATHTLFGRTGATTATSVGDSTDLGATYAFSDLAPSPPSGGWWQAATVTTAAAVQPTGTYRTTASGGSGATNPQPATNMDAAFSGLSNPNGTWVLRLTDGCSGDTGAITAASLSMLSGDPFGSSRADFDGDGRTDLSVFRPSEGNWYLNRSSSGFTAATWGTAGDIPAPGDFDGDLKADLAIFRPSNGTWWILRSVSSTILSAPFGSNGDVPVVGDYNGDGKSDIAVYRPSTSTWFASMTTVGNTVITPFGVSGDLPVRGDYDGDVKTDIAIFRPSNGQWWWVNSSSGSVSAVTFGLSTDKPVPADYDGDGREDIAIFRPSAGQWWTFSSLNGTVSAISFGISTDIPVPGDYDGDAKDDQAIYRNGTWWLNRSTGGVTASAFGLSTDTPIPAKYIP